MIIKRRVTWLHHEASRCPDWFL